MICGIGTDVGKTLAAAIIVQAIQGHYWKPVQAGSLEQSDTQTVQRLVKEAVCYPEAYRFLHPVSPHQASALEDIKICREAFHLPTPSCPLVIESTGGILVPMNGNNLLMDLYASWDCEWIVVSRHYVGSINHTLLTLEALMRRGVDLKGLIFNGPDEPFTENFILSYTGAPCLGHLYPERDWNQTIVKRYAHTWKSQL
jgi:dethiobiotin synthetase